MTLLSTRPSSQGFSAVFLIAGVIAFSPLIDGGTTHLPVFIIRSAILVATAIWLAVQLRLGEIVLYRARLFPLIGFFLGWSALSTVWSPSQPTSLQWVLSVLIYAIFFMYVAQGIRSFDDIRLLGGVVLMVGLVEACIGLSQFLLLGTERANGTFFNPNFFAAYEAVIIVMIVGIYVVAGWRQFGFLEHILLGGTAVIAVGAFFAAQSRGATVALVLGLTAVGVYRFGKSAVVVLLLAILAGVMIPNPLAERFRAVSSQDPYAYTRLDIWKSSLERIVDQPTGFGAGTYKYSSFRYQFPLEVGIVRYDKRAESAHNEYLQLGVELGAVGLAVFFLALWQWWRDVALILKTNLTEFERAGIVALSGGALVVISHAMVDSAFHEPALVFLLVLLGGLVVAIQRLKGMGPEHWWRISFVRQSSLVWLSGLGFCALALLTLQPILGWYAYTMGNKESSRLQSEQAMRWYHLAILVDPGTTAYRDAVVRQLLQDYRNTRDSNQLLEAIREMKVCTSLNTMDSRFPSRLASLYLMMASIAPSDGQRRVLLETAASSFEEAIRRSPFVAINYMELGAIRYQQNRMEDARKLAEKSISLEPNLLPARMLLAEVALRLDLHQVAVSELEAIHVIQKRYGGYTLSQLEKQFLDVDVAGLSRKILKEAS